jgi:opacity protein-like surface antigen
MSAAKASSAPHGGSAGGRSTPKPSNMNKYQPRSFNQRSPLKQFRLGAIAGAASLLLGLSPIAAQDAVMEEPEAPVVTGTLSLTGNTHFISYGQDIWGAGTSWDAPIFNPSIELSYDLGGGFSAILGTWWDLNNNAPSNIGNVIQEVDAWIGLGYGAGDWSFTLLYQEWMYASQSERIVDFIVGYDHWLNPSLTLHARVDHDIGPDFSNGLATVLGIAPGTEAGPVSFSFPVNVAFDTDEFHGGDAGFSFASVGAGASVPLTFLRGAWTLDAGVTFYHTNDDVIPSNPDEDFLTGSLGVTLAF